MIILFFRLASSCDDPHAQTALEPEADGVPLEGLAFHKFYFDAAAKTEAQVGACFLCLFLCLCVYFFSPRELL